MKNFTQHKMLLTDLLDTTFDQTVKDIQEGTFEIEVELNYGGWIGNIQGSIWSDGEFDLTDISFYSTMESGNNYHIESHDIPNGDKKFFDTIENKPGNERIHIVNFHIFPLTYQQYIVKSKKNTI